MRLSHNLRWALAITLMAGGLAHAAETNDPAKAMYLRYCAACHGAEGKGDGVASSTLRPPPSNLTLLAKENGGEFPTAKLMRYVDGTDDVRAHGDPAMPVWGEVFREEAISDATRRLEVRGKVMGIVAYIKSIQAP